MSVNVYVVGGIADYTCVFTPTIKIPNNFNNGIILWQFPTEVKLFFSFKQKFYKKK